MSVRFRRTRSAWGNRRAYVSRARGYARGGYNRMNKSYGGRFGLRITPTWAASFVAAFVVPDNSMIDAAAIAGATAPVKGMGMIRDAASGYLAGQLTQQFILPKLGININNIMGGTQNRFNFV